MRSESSTIIQVIIQTASETDPLKKTQTLQNLKLVGPRTENLGQSPINHQEQHSLPFKSHTHVEHQGKYTREEKNTYCYSARSEDNSPPTLQTGLNVCPGLQTARICVCKWRKNECTNQKEKEIRAGEKEEEISFWEPLSQTRMMYCSFFLFFKTGFFVSWLLDSRGPYHHATEPVVFIYTSDAGETSKTKRSSLSFFFLSRG